MPSVLLPIFQKIISILQTKRHCQIGGTWGSSYLYILSRLYSTLTPQVTLIVTENLAEAEFALEDWSTFFSDLEDKFSQPFLFSSEQDKISLQTQLQTIIALQEKRSPVFIITPIQSLEAPINLPPPEIFSSDLITIQIQSKLKMSLLIQKLIDTGFERVDQVEVPGQWSQRGGIVDIFPYERNYPIRIELVGEKICSIREFHPEEQTSLNKLKQVQLYLINPRNYFKGNATIFEYLPENTLVVLKADNLVGQDILIKKLAKYKLISFHSLPLGESNEEIINYGITSVKRFSGGLSNIISELRAMRERKYRISIFCQNQGEISRFREILTGTDLENDNEVILKIGVISQGFIFPEISHVFISHRELFNRYRQPRRFRTFSETKPIETFLELKKGDLVVHEQHGIGRYLGIENIQRDGFIQEYLVIEYHDRAKLYVPIYQISKVQKYFSSRTNPPPLDRLGTDFWNLRKERVTKAVNHLALELLEIQAIRKKEEGISFPEDTEWQTEFEASFPYEETPDQIKITEIIKRDMTSPKPMDRLICGDVGYGKTELAMRAAFKAATAGYQVAVLVPTTILAQQHYQTFTERMADYPINIEMLSRFRTPAAQLEIIKRLKEGQIDIIIGTHRLLSPDVQFKNLGLVIIDEEQRFGVEHKERLKKLRAVVDVLTLTATPIPRTLHMALIGIRDISTLATPPHDRRAVLTYVVPFSSELIREAILREINRQGQVYFVHNRIADIHLLAEKLQKIVPEASFIIVHGKLREDLLEERMKKFIQHEIDVLVTTNIIESGVDIPRVNTLFVNNAHQFGLSDLHQLRGRVGRYKYQAYAYFLIPTDEPISPEATQRLKTIQEFNELGAGFKIAMRDMEIRGVGNILGPQQHGHIAAVGYELYCRLLENAIRRLKRLPIKPTLETECKLNIDAYIPSEYIPSEKHRLEIYRKIGQGRKLSDFDIIKSELEDRFGRPIPEATLNLISLAEVKHLAKTIGISSLIQSTQTHNQLLSSDTKEVIIATYVNRDKIEKLIQKYPQFIRIIDNKTIYIILPQKVLTKPSYLLEFLKAIFRGYSREIREENKLV